MEDKVFYVDFRGQAESCYQKTGNPIYVWAEIAFCVEGKKQFPDWVLSYLGACSRRMFGPERQDMQDSRAALPYIFGFDLKAGAGSPLNVLEKELEIEPFAIAFSREILNGLDPTYARAEAEHTTTNDISDDKTLQNRLKKLFKLTSLPRNNTEWKKIVVLWLLERPHYFTMYPDMPDPVKLCYDYRDIFRELGFESVVFKGETAI